MNKLTITLIILSLLSLVRSDCGDGCLICKSDNTCLFCDFINGYFRDNTTCRLDETGNCALYQVSSANGACLRCLPSYFPSANGKCAPVEEPIPNCLVHTSETSCSACEAGFSLSGDLCSPLEEKIEGCLVHGPAESGLCDQCERNYMLSLDKRDCLPDPSDRYCAHYRFLECVECGGGRVKNSNAYLDIFKGSVEVAESLNQLVFDYLQGPIDWTNVGECSSIFITNCVEYESVKACKKCGEGFYLSSEKTCKKIPMEPLLNCKVYERAGECKECHNNFHLTQTNSCTENEEIEKCELFDGKAKKTSCLSCEEGFFLDSTCKPRENSEIENCEEYKSDKDECQTCAEGFVLTSDGLVCLTEIAGCGEYKASTKNTTSLECLECGDTFYLKDNLCEQGTVENCLVYLTGTETCSRCQTGFVLTEEGCSPRSVQIQRCALYNTTIEDECETCEESSLKFKVENSCKGVTSISNCSSYDTSDVCTSCEDGFKLEDNSCNPIDESLNCNKEENELCLDCKPDFYLEDGKCIQIPDIVKENCSNVENNSSTANACTACDVNHLPLKITTQSICRKPDLIETEITDCLSYNKTDSSTTCLNCSGDKIVSSDSLSCLDQCPEGEIAIIGGFAFDDTDVLTFDSSVTASTFKKCFSLPNNQPQLSNCSTAAHTINEKGNPLACIECNAGSVPTQGCPVNLSYFNKEEISTDDLLSSYVSLTCNNNANPVNGFSEQTGLNENCSYYELVEINGVLTWTCKACKFGKRGQIVNLGNNGEVSSVVCSNGLSGCDINVYFGGATVNSLWMRNIFGFTIPFKYSCHKCSNDQQIPFYHSKLNGDLRAYNISSNPPTNSNSFNGDAIVCREPTGSGLNVADEDFSEFPENCALGFIMIDRKKKVDLTVSSSVVCAACKNGHKPIYDSKGFMIVKCEPIEGCDVSSSTEGWFDSCKTCLSTHSFPIDETFGDVLYDSCVENSDPNCLVFNQTEEVNSCIECKKNFTFNEDKKCEAIKTVNCNNFNRLNTNLFSKTKAINQINNAFYKLFDQGCDSCSSDYIKIKTQVTIETCVHSPYIEAGIFNEENSEFSSGCVSYAFGVNNDLLCKECGVGFVLSSNNQNCFPNDDLLFCKVSDAIGVKCEQCDSTHTVVNGTCVEKSILNCKEYSNSNTTLTCVFCEDSFILIENKCETGPVDNCKEYSNSTGKCMTCIPGFVLIGELSVGQKCLQIPVELACVSAKINETNDGITCEECQQNFGFTTDPIDFNSDVCINADTVDNCVKYDIKTNLLESTFNCLECSLDFFLDSNKCQPRLNLEGCKVPNPTANICSVCEDNYLFNSQDVCESLLVGTAGCLTYIDVEGDSVCFKCNKNSYLSEDKKCLLVPEDQRIEGCKEYSDDKTCSVCETDQYLSENTCIPSEALDCLTQTDIKNCASCDVGRHLKENQDNETVNCVVNTVGNCTLFEKDADVCLQCETGYYADEEGKCAVVLTTIEGCDVYENLTGKCSKCQTDLILASNKESCVEGDKSSFGGCSILRYNSDPVCVACEAGYFFENGKCTSCIDQSYGDGCMFCDYADTGTCLICRSGYTMSKDKECKVNENLISIIKNEIDGEDKGEKTKRVGIVIAFLLIFFRV